MAKNTNDVKGDSSRGITASEEHENDFGVHPDDGDEEKNYDDGERRLLAGPGNVFENAPLPLGFGGLEEIEVESMHRVQLHAPLLGSFGEAGCGPLCTDRILIRV
jgi:hypothetical protein